MKTQPKCHPDREHHAFELCRQCYQKSKYDAQKGPCNKNARRGRWLKKVYGITAADFNEMEKRQDYGCAICRSKGKLVIDHDHETNNIRELLCSNCNTGIGLFYENPRLLLAAAEYISRHERNETHELIESLVFSSDFLLSHWSEEHRDKDEK